MVGGRNEDSMLCTINVPFFCFDFSLLIRSLDIKQNKRIATKSDTRVCVTSSTRPPHSRAAVHFSAINFVGCVT